MAWSVIMQDICGISYTYHPINCPYFDRAKPVNQLLISNAISTTLSSRLVAVINPTVSCMIENVKASRVPTLQPLLTTEDQHITHSHLNTYLAKVIYQCITNDDKLAFEVLGVSETSSNL